MNKVIKKSIAMLICLTFLTLAVTSSTAIDVPQQDLKVEDPAEEITTTSETVTLYRHGLDGSITPIEVDIILEEGQDIQDAINAQCRQLVENDPVIQKALEELQNLTFGIAVYVESSGKGFHFKLGLFEKLFIRFWQWKLLIPRVATILANPLVFCRYPNDGETYYETLAPSEFLPYLGIPIPPLLEQFLWRQDRNVTITGPHSVVVNSFIGFTSLRWFGRIHLGNVGFFGYGRFVLTNDKL